MTREEALQKAAEFGLESEVQWEMDNGCPPEQALVEWDIY